MVVRGINLAHDRAHYEALMSSKPTDVGRIAAVVATERPTVS